MDQPKAKGLKMKAALSSLILLMGLGANAQSLQELDMKFSQNAQSLADVQLFEKLVEQVFVKYGKDAALDMKSLVKDEGGNVRYLVGEKLVCNVVTVYYTQLGLDRCIQK